MSDQAPVRDPEVLRRMAIAFDLYETAVRMERQTILRRNPEATEEEIREGIRAWHHKGSEDFGAGFGRPVSPERLARLLGMNPGSPHHEAFDTDGFVVLDGAVSRAEVERLRGVLEGVASQPESARRGGVRSLLDRSGDLASWAESGLPAALARSLLGPTVRPVKATLFDKTSAANWKVPWHQDLTIAVRERREVPGFGPWTVKDGVPHVQPPAEVLEAMVAVRVHLDDTPVGNGALRVVPGSHRCGRLSKQRAAEVRKERGEVVCPVPAGGAMVMRPLLLHASSAVESPARRRVVHIEYSCGELPAGLRWR